MRREWKITVQLKSHKRTNLNVGEKCEEIKKRLFKEVEDSLSNLEMRR